MAGHRIPELNGRARAAVEPAGLSPATCARVARMVVNSARDAAEAAMLLEMLDLTPAPAKRRHLEVVPGAALSD